MAAASPGNRVIAPGSVQRIISPATIYGVITPATIYRGIFVIGQWACREGRGPGSVVGGWPVIVL